MNAAAGWFDDPSNPSQHRWWDGAQWTEHVRPKPPAGGWFDDPATPGQLRWWDGAQWTQHVQSKTPTTPLVERATALLGRMKPERTTAPTERTKPERTVNANEGTRLQPAKGGTRLRFSKGDFEFDVVGMHYHWAEVCKVAGKCPKDSDERVRNLTLEMRRDPGNKHDANAIAVFHDEHGHIGFVPRDLAEQLAPALDKAARKLPEPVTWLFTAEMTAEWDVDDRSEPEDVSFRAMIDEEFRAKPVK